MNAKGGDFNDNFGNEQVTSVVAEEVELYGLCD